MSLTSGIAKSMNLADGAKPELAKLKKATDGFETMFVKKLLTEMRKGVKEVSFGDSTGSEVYQDLMDQAVAESVSKGGSLGIGKILYKQFAPQIIAQAQAHGAARQAAYASPVQGKAAQPPGAPSQGPETLSRASENRCQGPVELSREFVTARQGPGKPPQTPGKPPQGPGKPPQTPGKPPQTPATVPQGPVNVSRTFLYHIDRLGKTAAIQPIRS